MARKQPKRASLVSLCSDFFMLGLGIAEGQIELPAPDQFKRRVLMLVEAMRNKAHQLAIMPAEVDDATYAVAAYLDEVIHYSQWPGKQTWSSNPLQAVLFNESRAGANFFHRLQAVRQREGEALEVYYLCLVLGFMGEYRFTAPEQLHELIQQLRRELGAAAKKLSPHGLRPDETVLGGKSLPLIPIAAVCLLLAVCTIAAFYLLLSWNASEAVELLGQMGKT